MFGRGGSFSRCRRFRRCTGRYTQAAAHLQSSDRTSSHFDAAYHGPITDAAPMPVKAQRPRERVAKHAAKVSLANGEIFSAEPGVSVHHRRDPSSTRGGPEATLDCWIVRLLGWVHVFRRCDFGLARKMPLSSGMEIPAREADNPVNVAVSSAIEPIARVSQLCSQSANGH